MLSRIQPYSHTPKVGFEKSQKIVIFWIFLHPSTCSAKHDKRPKIPPLQNLSKDEIDKLVREYI